MKFCRLLTLIFTISICSQINLFAQEKVKIAVFVPLSIDDAFTNNEFSVSGNSFPKSMYAGLEFYNGILMGVDSLNRAGINNISLQIYDSKSSNKNIESIVNSVEFSNTKLIITSSNLKNDLKALSNYASANQIPLISATLPNEAGVSNNPYFFIFNPTLRTHCKSIINYIQTNHSKANVIYLSKTGSFEKMVADYCTEFNTELDKPIKWKQKIVTDSFSTEEIINFLDSTKQNVIIGGVSNGNLVNKLVKIAADLKAYKINIIGLPVWEQLKIDEKLARVGLNVLYGSSYSFNKKNRLIQYIDKKYSEKFFGKPNDMVYKGYESFVKFATLAASNSSSSFLEAINATNNQIFSFTKFIPIKMNADAVSIDYFENVGIQFLRKL